MRHLLSGTSDFNSEEKDTWTIIGIDKQSYASCPLHMGPANFYIKDINDMNHLPDADVIFHFAAESHVGHSIKDSKEFTRSNVLGTQNLLEMVREKNPEDRPLFFHVSTDEVYGDIKYGFFNESDILNPSNPYAASKAAAEHFVRSYARTYGIQYKMIRPTNMYGPGQYHEKLIPLAVKRLNEYKKIQIHDKGTPVRTWLHVQDCCDAIMRIYYAGVINQVYNCSGGFEQSNMETVSQILLAYFPNQHISDLLEKHIDFSYSRPGQDFRYALNDFALHSLGWEPRKYFKREIKNIVSSLKKC
jgi:dTDP-glucose 4,6-dehydratase